MSARAGEPSREASEQVGAYLLDERIAFGSLCESYRGRDLQGRPCVIRRLRKEQRDDLDSMALFRASGQLAKATGAPEIVSVSTVCELPELLLVMDYVRGPSLASLLALPVTRELQRCVITALSDALVGLHALHTLCVDPIAVGDPGFVHCAPSPRHILISQQGVGRVLDLTHAVGAGMPWSERRDLCLSPAYMAPEQLLAPRFVDRRCDLFIVGTVLWQALTGRSLFGAACARQALHKVLKEPILLPSEAGASSVGGLDRVCARALSRFRGARYSDALEMAAALRYEAERVDLLATRHELASFVQGLLRREASVAQDPPERTTLAGPGPAAGPAAREPTPVHTASAVARPRKARLALIAMSCASAAGAMWWWTSYDYHESLGARPPVVVEAAAGPVDQATGARGPQPGRIAPAQAPALARSEALDLADSQAQARESVRVDRTEQPASGRVPLPAARRRLTPARASLPDAPSPLLGDQPGVVNATLPFVPDGEGREIPPNPYAAVSCDSADCD